MALKNLYRSPAKKFGSKPWPMKEEESAELSEAGASAVVPKTSPTSPMGRMASTDSMKVHASLQHRKMW
jgi:hypothetical protein